MIDESTDISATSHLVMFATIVEEGLPVIVFSFVAIARLQERCCYYF